MIESNLPATKVVSYMAAAIDGPFIFPDKNLEAVFDQAAAEALWLLNGETTNESLHNAGIFDYDYLVDPDTTTDQHYIGHMAWNPGMYMIPKLDMHVDLIRHGGVSRFSVFPQEPKECEKTACEKVLYQGLALPLRCLSIEVDHMSGYQMDQIAQRRHLTEDLLRTYMADEGRNSANEMTRLFLVKRGVPTRLMSITVNLEKVDSQEIAYRRMLAYMLFGTAIAERSNCVLNRVTFEWNLNNPTVTDEPGKEVLFKYHENPASFTYKFTV